LLLITLRRHYAADAIVCWEDADATFYENSHTSRFITPDAAPPYAMLPLLHATLILRHYYADAFADMPFAHAMPLLTLCRYMLLNGHYMLLLCHAYCHITKYKQGVADAVLLLCCFSATLLFFFHCYIAFRHFASSDAITMPPCHFFDDISLILMLPLPPLTLLLPLPITLFIITPMPRHAFSIFIFRLFH